MSEHEDEIETLRDLLKRAALHLRHSETSNALREEIAVALGEPKFCRRILDWQMPFDRCDKPMPCEEHRNRGPHDNRSRQRG